MTAEVSSLDRATESYDGPVIEADGLTKHFPMESGLVSSLLGGETRYVKAVDGVDLHIDSGETVGLVGESGCGKSTLGEVLIGLQEPTAGSIRFFGQELTGDVPRDRMRKFRQNVQMVFQDPYESTNPRFTIGQWIREPLEIHDVPNKRERVLTALERAELSPGEAYLDQYPHQLSGGQRQRVSIARAIVLEPKFIVADEPVSMLDVSVRASVLDTLQSLGRELDMAVLYISHDLSLIKQMCDRTMVMYLGKVVESGPTDDLIGDPKHPYSQALVDAVPVPKAGNRVNKPPLEGEPPDPVDLPEGCNFRPRCPYATDVCYDEPTLDAWSADGGARHASCHRVGDFDPAHIRASDE